MYSVYQHWDPLKVCVVGRSYPPEFYSWISIPHVRDLMEKIAIETEEDYQQIIDKLQEFGVEVLRPKFPEISQANGRYIPPPMCPRDDFVMIGEDFYAPKLLEYPDWDEFYSNIKGTDWPQHVSSINDLPVNLQRECVEVHKWNPTPTAVLPGKSSYSQEQIPLYNCYGDIVEHIQSQGNKIKVSTPGINGAMVARVGRDLYFGTQGRGGVHRSQQEIQSDIDIKFPNNRNHVVDTQGHSDGTYCPVCPGLIVSLEEISTYAKTFPDWEVLYLPNQSWYKVRPFMSLKQKNHGKWWIPGFEYDNDVIETIETWLGHWTGYVEETVFDVNMLIIDPKNVMVFNYNKQVFDALDRYGITPHIVPFRHRYFWDGGIHCVTLDLHREGTMQDYFPGRT